MASVAVMSALQDPAESFFLWALKQVPALVASLCCPGVLSLSTELSPSRLSLSYSFAEKLLKIIFKS
jgi:hypothetical protein